MNNDQIEQNAEILKRIADNFPVNSEEYKALRISALAFSYVALKCEKQFDEFIDNLWKPLTPSETAKLEKITIKVTKSEN